jgi:hypothetical protein
MLLKSIIMYCEMSKNILENIHIKTHINNTEIYFMGKHFQFFLFLSFSLPFFYSENWPPT